MRNDKPIFLIQNNYFDQIGRLIQPCLDFCREHNHEFIDRSLSDDFNPDALGINWSDWPAVIIYGSVGWVKRCRVSSLGEYTFYDPDAFAASRWVPLFLDNALNGGGKVLTVKEARQKLESGEILHMRPDSDDKAFVGAVYDAATWGHMLGKRTESRQKLPADDLACFVSPVRKIDAEYRCWFVGGELIDISVYKKGGLRHIERCANVDVWKAAQCLSEVYLPSENVVMDIAETASGVQVIEFNPICSSGWYAANTSRVLGAWSEMLLTRKVFALK